MSRFVLSVALVLSAACCKAQDQPNQPLTANIHIYRPHNKIFGNAMSPIISCGRDVIAKVPTGSSLVADVAPGKCLMRASYLMYFDEHPMDLEAVKTTTFA